jgi:hypothetical protein
MQEAVSAAAILMLGQARIGADKKRRNFRVAAEHSNSIDAIRALRKPVIADNQVWTLAKLAQLHDRVTATSGRDHPAAPGTQETPRCLENKAIIIDHDDKFAFARCLHGIDPQKLQREIERRMCRFGHEIK